MIDGFDRTITYLRVSITDRCNLRCRYCMPEEGIDPRRHSDILSFEEISAIVAQAVSLGVRKVRVTGGEPLVRLGAVDLCRQLKAIDGLEELAITTNGLLLERYAQQLKDAGVDRVNLSLDTLNEEKYRSITRGGDLNAALRGLEAARRAGLTPMKLNAVLIGGFNDDEIPALVDLTRDQDLEVRFIELMPLGPGAAFPPEAAIPAQAVLDRVPELEPVGSGGVARLYQLPGAKGKVGLITPVSHDFCSRCDRVRLTADGKLKPCLHSDREIPLRGLTGDALRAALIDGIRSKPAQHPDFTPGQTTAGGRSMNRIGG